MRILHVIQSVDPRYGGPVTVLCQQVREQVAAGHDVTVLATTIQLGETWRPPDEYRRAMQTNPYFAGARLHQVPALGRRSPWSNLAFSPAGGRWLRRRFANPQLRPEVLHINGVFGYIQIRSAALARRYRVPYIISPAGSLDAATLGMNHRRLKQLYRWLVLDRDVRHAAFVHVTSDAERQNLVDGFRARRVQLIPLGVDVPPADLSAPAAEFLDRFPQLRNRRAVLFLARIHPIKRIHLLVEAFARLQSEFPEAMLVLAGSDEGHQAEIELLVTKLGIDESVLFTGFLERELKTGAFACCDLFALTSSHENFGISVVEAMAHGLPVLVTPEVASHAFVDQANAGLTVDGDVQAVASGLRRLFARSPNGMGQRGRRFVETQLGWPTVAKQIESMYSEAIGSNAHV